MRPSAAVERDRAGPAADHDDFAADCDGLAKRNRAQQIDAAEYALLSTPGLDVRIVRPFNVAGPRVELAACMGIQSYEKSKEFAHWYFELGFTTLKTETGAGMNFSSVERRDPASDWVAA